MARPLQCEPSWKGSISPNFCHLCFLMVMPVGMIAKQTIFHVKWFMIGGQNQHNVQKGEEAMLTNGM